MKNMQEGKVGSLAALLCTLVWAAAVFTLLSKDLQQGAWLTVTALALTPAALCVLPRSQAHTTPAAEAEAMAWEKVGESGTPANSRASA